MGLMDKMMEKKGSKPLDPMYKDAKMSMLHELRNAMSGAMKSDLENAKGMKKVEVASDSPEGLASGLDKAKDMVSGAEGENSEAAEAGGDMMSEMMEGQMADGQLSPEKIDMLIEMLQKKKMEMSGDSEEIPGGNKFGLGN